MLSKKRLSSIFLITGLFLCLLIQSATLNAQEPKEETQMKVAFYTFDKEAQSKGEFLGFAELKGGKLNIEVTDPKLEKFLKSDFVTTGGETEEITLPDGEKVLRGGMIIYESGTIEHLKAVIYDGKELGYIGEVIE